MSSRKAKKGGANIAPLNEEAVEKTVEKNEPKEEKAVEVFYKVGVNRFRDKMYAEKFAARKGLVVEIVKE